MKDKLDIGTVDVTFYRDDFETNLGTPKIGPSDILFNISNEIIKDPKKKLRDLKSYSPLINDKLITKFTYIYFK